MTQTPECACLSWQNLKVHEAKTEMEKEKSTIIVRDFNTLLAIDRRSRQNK